MTPDEEAYFCNDELLTGAKPDADARLVIDVERAEPSPTMTGVLIGALCRACHTPIDGEAPGYLRYHEWCQNK